MKEIDYISVDTETGGLRPSVHALLQIAAVASWAPEQPFMVYLLPGHNKLVESQAAEKNGYNEELWIERGAVGGLTGMRWFCEWLDKRFAERPDARMLAHNFAFDKGFLDEYAAIYQLKMPKRHAWRDSMTALGDAMDDGMVPDGGGSLERLGELCGFWPKGTRPAVHEAHEDAMCCLAGMQWLRRLRSSEIGF